MGIYENLRLIGSTTTRTTAEEREYLWKERQELSKQLNLTRRETGKSIARERLADMETRAKLQASAIKLMANLAETEGKNSRAQLQVIQRDMDSLRDSWVKLRGQWDGRAASTVLRAMQLGPNSNIESWEALVGSTDHTPLISGKELNLPEIWRNAMMRFGDFTSSDPQAVNRYKNFFRGLTLDRNGEIVVDEDSDTPAAAQQRRILGVENQLLGALEQYSEGHITPDEALRLAKSTIKGMAETPMESGYDDTTAEATNQALEEDEFFQAMEERFTKLTGGDFGGSGMQELGKLVGSSDAPTPFRKWAESNGARLGEARLDEDGKVEGYVPGRDDIAALYRAYSQMRRKPDSLLRKSTREWVKVQLKDTDYAAWKEEYGAEGDTPTQTVYFYTSDPDTGEKVYVTPEQVGSLIEATGQGAPVYPGEDAPEGINGPAVYQTSEAGVDEKNLTVYGKRIRQHISDPEDSIRVLTDTGEYLYGPDEVVDVEVTAQGVKPGERIHDTLVGALGRTAAKKSRGGAELPDEERKPLTDVGLTVGSDLPTTPVDRTARRRQTVLDRINREEGRAEDRTEKREARQELWQPVRDKANAALRGFGEKFRTDLPDTSQEHGVFDPYPPQDIDIDRVPPVVPGAHTIRAAKKVGETLEDGTYHPMSESGDRVRAQRATVRQARREQVDPLASVGGPEGESEALMPYADRPSQERAEQEKREREDQPALPQDISRVQALREATKKRRLARQSELNRGERSGQKVTPLASQLPTTTPADGRVSYKSPHPAPPGLVLPIGPDPGEFSQKSPMEMPKAAQEQGRKDYQEAVDQGEQDPQAALKKKRRQYLSDYIARTA